MTFTLTSDDLESHIVVNVSSTLTNTNISFVAALCLIVDVRTDIFTRFIMSSLRRWPKNGQSVVRMLGLSMINPHTRFEVCSHNTWYERQCKI